MNNLTEIVQAFAGDPYVTYGIRCCFCSGMEDAEGSLGVEISPGNFMELPIGDACLKKARDSSAKWVDKPDEPVLD